MAVDAVATPTLANSPAVSSPIVASATDPDGRMVSLSRERWEHIIDGHPELVTLQTAVMAAVQLPARRALPTGGWPGEEWCYGRDVGPARWLKVVVLYEQGNGRILTAFPRRAFP